MKRKSLFPFGLLIILCLSGAAYVNPIDSNPIGRKYQGAITIGDMTLPLPEGEWEVVGRGYTDFDKFSEVYLEKDSGNKPHSILFIKREYSPPPNKLTGYPPNKLLERNDLHHVVTLNNRKGEAHDGWAINHVRLKFGNDDTPAKKELYKHIIDNKIEFPDTFLVTFHHFTGDLFKMKFLVYSIYVNPELEGFEPPENSDRVSSDWHPRKVNNDPKKIAFIEKLKEEGTVFHKQLKEAFGK